MCLASELEANIPTEVTRGQWPFRLPSDKVMRYTRKRVKHIFK